METPQNENHKQEKLIGDNLFAIQISNEPVSA
jgi:hypothetical protein